MAVEIVRHTTSWIRAIVSWYLIWLFGKLARGRSPWTGSAEPHDASSTIPPHLKRHYGVQIERLALEDPDVPLPPPSTLPQPPPSARPAAQGEWTKARIAWLTPLTIFPHPHPHHSSRHGESFNRPYGSHAALSQSRAKRVVLYLHGGGFVNPLSAFHWKFASRLASKLDAMFVMQTYTLLPWGGVWDVLPPLLVIYRELQQAATAVGMEFIVLGDSAGGNIAAALTLAARDGGLPPPDQLVLVAPGLESALSVEAAKEAEKQCAILTASGMVVSRRHWAIGATDPEALVHELSASTPRPSKPGETQAALHPYASPLRADWSWLTSIPAGKSQKTKVTLISGEWDLSYSLSVLPFCKKLQFLGPQVEATVIVSPYAVHDYPIFIDTPLPVFVGSQEGLNLLVSSILAYSA